MASSVLLYTIAGILVSSVLSFFVSQRRLDQCLRHFDGYKVTMVQKDGKRIWGKLVASASGVEFRYEQPYQLEDHVETSFVLFKGEFKTMHALVRYRDDMSRAHHLRWRRDKEHSFRPNFLAYQVRHVRNVLWSIKDGIGQAFMTVGSASANPALKAMAVQQGKNADSGPSFATSYDPLLERYIGRRAVVQVAVKERPPVEYVGTLKDYSPNSLELADLTIPDGGVARECDVIVLRSDSVLRHGAEPLKRGAKREAAATAPVSGPQRQKVK